MYKLIRMMLIAAVVFLGVATVMLCLMVGWPGWVALALLLAIGLKKKGKMLTVLGSGRWASEAELQQAGMLGGKRGYIPAPLPAQRLSPATLVNPATVIIFRVPNVLR